MTPPVRAFAEQLDLPLEPPPPPTPALPELWTPDDIWEAASQTIIGLFREDSRVERKSSRIEPKDLAPYLSAFANHQPHGGVLFVGIEEDGRFTGCRSISHERLQALEKIGLYCSDARYDVRRIPIRRDDGEEDFVLAFRVLYRTDKLVEMSDGIAWVKFGNAKRRLTEQEKRELRIARGEIDYEKEDMGAVFPADYDNILLKEFCISFLQKRNLLGDHSTEDVMMLNRLGRVQGKQFIPNLACFVLFGKDPKSQVPGAYIKFMRFDGNEERSGNKYNLVKDEFVEGPLPRQIQQIDRLIQSQMRDFTRLGRNGRFYTSAEYPRDAWLEAVVNACVHRSYNLRNMNIFVKMFNDRIVVESPGGFPPPVTPANIYECHNPRNPHLMYALFYLDYVKCGHEGTRRMREEMSEANLPAPEFLQREVVTHQVHVTLRNNYEARKMFVDTEAVRLIGLEMFDKLDAREKAVVNYIAERGQSNVMDANRMLKCDWRTARNIMDDLCRKGVLARVSSGKSRDSKARYVLMKAQEHEHGKD